MERVTKHVFSAGLLIVFPVGEGMVASTPVVAVEATGQAPSGQLYDAVTQGRFLGRKEELDAEAILAGATLGLKPEKPIKEITREKFGRAEKVAIRSLGYLASVGNRIKQPTAYNADRGSKVFEDGRKGRSTKSRTPSLRD